MTTTNTTPTLSRPVVRVLKAIGRGDSWRATHETVDFIVVNGLAHFVDWDEAVSTGGVTGWTLTEAGLQAVDPVNHPSITKAIRAAYRAASVLSLDEAASLTRELHLSWKGGNLCDIHNMLSSIANALGNTVGAHDALKDFNRVRLAALQATQSTK